MFSCVLSRECINNIKWGFLVYSVLTGIRRFLSPFVSVIKIDVEKIVCSLPVICKVFRTETIGEHQATIKVVMQESIPPV